MLKTKGIVKRFGMLTAVDRVDLEIRQGEIHALIGPNGAGKTTLINLLAGELKPDAGTIRFEDRDISGLPVHKRALMGMSRTFQITNILRGFSALENVALAVQAHTGHSFKFWHSARTDPALLEPAAAVLERAGLTFRHHIPASLLSHGERRQVGIAMALASDPKLMLLDEPMAGLGVASAKAMMDLIRSLKGKRTLLLVEHDMDAVFSLADRISVMVYGTLAATGTPDEIRKNETVIEAYLGKEKRNNR